MLHHHYFSTGATRSCESFSKQLDRFLKSSNYSKKEVVFLCIGSDRATGDSLGPILGYKLQNCGLEGIFVYGTLEAPVHAQNLKKTLCKIHRKHPDCLMIAVDASLGEQRHIGYVTLSNHSIQPGIGVQKLLPCAGDISITGIVNCSCDCSAALLQTTRLQIVVKIADFLLEGILGSKLAAQR